MPLSSNDRLSVVGVLTLLSWGCCEDEEDKGGETERVWDMDRVYGSWSSPAEEEYDVALERGLLPPVLLEWRPGREGL